MATTQPSGDSFMAAIRQAVEHEIEKAVVVETERAKRELDRRIPEIVSGLAIRVMERVSIETLRHELLIHVKMEDARKNDRP